MNFKEALNNLKNGKAIMMSCGIEEYPPLMNEYFLLDDNKIIDSYGNDLTFTMLTCAVDDNIKWEIYEPTKEELLLRITKMKQQIDNPHRLYHELGSGLNVNYLQKPSLDYVHRANKDFRR